MIYQDWEPVVLKKPQKSTTSHINNPANTKKLRELEGDDIIKPTYVSKEQSQLLIEARNAKNLKQKELAKRCNLDVSIIASYENGSAIFSKQLYNKILKNLGVSVGVLDKK